MGLRCLLFTSDEEAAASIRRVLDDLGIEEESCSVAVSAVQQITQQAYQFVIIDWDQQPEAGLLLSAARERKASDRPLTLAIVSDENSVSKALQAGANSILRKPLLLNQVNDTLKTGRDLVRARTESAVGATVSVSNAPPPTPLPSMVEGSEKTLRAGEFLQSSATAPGGQFDTESDLQKSLERSAVSEIDPLKELEPMAAAVTPAKAEPAPQTTDEPRGLQWFLNRRAAILPKAPVQAAAQTPVPPPQSNPELLGFDQMASQPEGPQSPQVGWKIGAKSETKIEIPPETVREDTHEAGSDQPIRHNNENKDEAELFAYISGERKQKEPESKSGPRFHLGKGPIVAAAMLAGCAILAAPQAPWHAGVAALWRHERVALHAWLNPQPVIPAQAPESHENFARAGDEYKLPVAENIPDATTDPSQIRVVPVVDPTAKKSPGVTETADQTAGQADAATANQDATNQGQTNQDQANQGQASHDQGTPGIQVQESPTESAATTGQPARENAAPGANPETVSGNGASASAIVVQPHQELASATPTATSPVISPSQLPPQRVPQIRVVSSAATPPIPSSLKSQMASMTPDASGNKPVEAAMQSIEPVRVPEAAERTLLTDQPAPAYPASAKSQQGTVVLEVLIGRDGAVQDAKFLQGSLAFARAAIDVAKQWKFKPYIMNGRPVSVQTSLTMSFKPVQ